MTHRQWKENETRACRKCGELRTYEQFTVDKRTKDGVSGFCRQCAKISVTNWQKRNQERIRQTKRAWRKRRPDATRRETVLCRSRNPKAYQARYAAHNAKKAGKILQQACRDCGSMDTQAHHPDYSKPLDVIWLCPKHHAAEHKNLKNQEAI